MPEQGPSKQTLTSDSRSSLRQSWDKTLNASITLEDFAGDDQDVTSRGSRSSLASRSQVDNTYSQTYFSLDVNNRNQETASFHTALQDGFSLSAYESRQDLDYYDNTRHSREDDYSEREAMLSQTDFQVFWDGITYKIEPKISLASIWYDCFHLFRSRLSTSFESIRRTKSDRYNVSNSNNRSASLLKKEPLTIIDQISGSFKSGELTAVMGPSGAGKTSLLNLLSRRQENGYTGELYVNNAHRRIKISTIPQHDHLPEYLTVCENLMFASRLKNIHPLYDHKKNIAKVSNLLGLDDCLHTRTRKISGGQQKRLSIAQELLSMPDILILDEPTSGLDSLTCYKTISVLKDLVKSSKRKLIDPIAIVVTIHQPQQEVFDIFDKVYIMANGGITIYDGRPEDCVNFVQRNSGIQMPGEDYNPASFLIEIASGEYGCEPIKALRDRIKKDFVANRRKFKKEQFRAIDIERTQQVDNIHGEQSSVNRSNIKNDDLSRNSNDESNIIQVSGGDRKENRKPFLYIDQRIVKGSSVNRGHFWLKTRILSKRCWLSFTRDPKQMIARILFHIFLPINMAVIMGTEPGQSNACPAFEAQYKIQDLVNDTIETSSDRQEELLLSLENVSLLFVLIYALSSANIVAVALSFNQDMLSSLKEFHNGWYSMTSYIAARFITDAPMEIFLPILTLSIAYPLTGQDPGSAMPVIYRITITACAMILGSMVGETIGMIFGAIYVGHLSTALFASQGSTLPLVFVSGFVVRTKSMSKFARFLSQFSFYKHVLEITLVARYGYNVCLCNAQTFLNGHNTQLVGIPDRLKVFTEFWLNSFSENIDQTTTIPSLTSNDSQVENLSENKTGLFDVFAKQISLFNTYGVEVESCKDIKPFHLHAYAVDEQDLPRAFLALIILLVVIRLLLFLTVKLLLHFKTSL